jgi:transcriptional regulator with XRE-family HTH domain
MSPQPTVRPAAPAVLARVDVVAASLGAQVCAARKRRRWSTQQVADRAGVSRALVYRVERGDQSTLETYVRLGAVLGLSLEAALEDPRTTARPHRAEDPVHAAIVEMLAARHAGPGRLATADEPFQHYQFAGRADLAVIDPTGPDLLHHEVKTAIPNVGELAGSWNVKRQYLARVLAERHGIRGGFRSVTHVLTIAWTADCLRVLRLHAATFRTLGPDDPIGFTAWWEGGVPASPGSAASVVLLDPIQRPRAVPWIGIKALASVRPRHAGYAEALTALRDASRA